MPVSRHRRRRGRAVSRGSGTADSLSLTRPRRKKTNKFYLAAAITIAVLVIGSFGLSTIPFGSGGVALRTGDNDRYVPEVGIQQTILAANHLAEGTEINYFSFPPTSGEHWPPHVLRTCGFYEDGLRDEVVVHHLEHGNIVVSYNFSDPVQVDQLRRAIDDIGLANLWGISRFYDQIPEGQVAIAAWGVLDTMEGVDKGRLERFFEYAGNLGPETFPCI